MQNFRQLGAILALTAPSGGVVSGSGYQIGQLFVVATNNADEGTTFQGAVTGVFTLPKTTGAAWTEGQLIYWKTSTAKAITTAEDNLLIGVATAAAVSGDTTGTVRLNGIGRTQGDIADDTVDTDAIQDDAITTAKIADDAVTTAKIADDAVTTAKIADDAVTTAKIADDQVTAAKLALFVSTEQTGTGSSQNVAHGLGSAPGAVVIAVTEYPGGGGGFDVAEGSHDGTNVVVTVTTGVKFKVFALA